MGQVEALALRKPQERLFTPTAEEEGGGQQGSRAFLEEGLLN